MSRSAIEGSPGGGFGALGAAGLPDRLRPSPGPSSWPNGQETASQTALATATRTIAVTRARLVRGRVGTRPRVGRACEIPDKRVTNGVLPDTPTYMTLATLGSIFIIIGIAALAAGVALPIAYALRMRAAARPSPRTLHRAPSARIERVSA